MKRHKERATKEDESPSLPATPVHRPYLMRLGFAPYSDVRMKEQKKKGKIEKTRESRIKKAKRTRKVETA